MYKLAQTFEAAVRGLPVDRLVSWVTTHKMRAAAWGLGLFWAGYNLAKNYGWLPKKDLRGKHVILTGAAGGMGRIFTQMLAEMGCKLSLLDINDNELILL
jgi:hypothetical protein